MVPFIYGIYLTLTDWNGVSSVKNFVGLSNFAAVMRDAQFWKSLLLTFKYVIAVVGRYKTLHRQTHALAEQTGRYIAKVTVTFDSDGKVVSVVDNGTAPDSNSYFWNIALGHFDRFVGVTKDTVDSVDATSGATVSMNAVKEAVKNALSK